MRWKFATIVLIFTSIILAFGLISAHLRAVSANKALDAYIDAEAKKKGFDKGTFETPKIPDAPAGSKKIFRIEGEVTFAPEHGASRPEPSKEALPEQHTDELSDARPIHPETIPTSEIENLGCSLDDVWLRIKCVADGISSPSAPYGRMMAGGTLRGFGQVRDFPLTPAGNVGLQMAPWLNPALWHADFLVGVAGWDRLGYEIGASWTGRSRFGPYVLAEYQPAVSGDEIFFPSTESFGVIGALDSTWRVHVGMRVRLK